MGKAKKSLESIKTGVVARSASLTSLAIKSGFRIASAKLKGGDPSPQAMEEVFRSNAAYVVKELGRLKGSAMKMGQSLAVIGEHFFSKEVASILRNLNQDSEALSWQPIEATLKRSLGSKVFEELVVDQDSFAAASLGQVHLAQVKKTGQKVCVKVQYPGVAKSIDSDLKTLKSILKIARILPQSSSKTDQIFEEVRAMLKMEVDYLREAKNMAGFRDWLSKDERYRVPDYLPDFSSRVVLTTSFEEGVGFDSPSVAALPLERRVAVSSHYTELFLRELFEYRAVQSDPHFGNYKLKLDDKEGRDVLVLLDFGAVRRFSKPFIKSYYQLLWGAFSHDTALIEKGGKGIGFLLDSDSKELIEKFCDFCFLVIEPWLAQTDKRANQKFYDDRGYYCWHATDLPKRLQVEGRKLAVQFRFRLPPREVVFLDRKLAGVFTALKILAAPFDAHALMEKVLGGLDLSASA